MATTQSENHYTVLGLQPSATADEVRRAYRILARRYHPDLNPGKASEARFKQIAEAYRVLSDPQRRQEFDASLGAEAARTSFTGANKRQRPSARERFYQQKYENFGKTAAEEPQRQRATPTKPPKQGPAPFGALFDRLRGSTKSIFDEVFTSRRATRTTSAPPPLSKVSIIEVSVSLREAIYGVRRNVEIEEPEGVRKIAVRIPAGVRSGSVVRLQSKGNAAEEVVLIVKVAPHPFLSLQQRGLVLEVPITINEAISGASISVPTLEEEVVVRVPAGTQSGNELRVRGKGVLFKDGQRGDLFVRFLVRVPESPEAVGLKERAAELDRYYESNVRSALQQSMTEIAGGER